MKKPSYKSSIPASATERIVARYSNGAKREAKYFLKRKPVGLRIFFDSGEPGFEYGLKNGKKHGVQYEWLMPGMLSSAEPFIDGLMHGTTRQWDERGRLVGTYDMVHGTGIDLWRCLRGHGKAYVLSEVMHWQDGRFHGFEWWLNDDQRTVWKERHWRDGQLHGVEREWNNTGRLARGYPKYHVSGNVVTKRQYLKAAASDPTLPPFQIRENKPARTFPPEIAGHLRR